MSTGQGIGRVLEPEPEWAECECICGRRVRVPNGLAGRSGTCPSCGRPFVMPGKPTENPKPGGVFVMPHPEKEMKLLFQEPNLAPRESGYSSAQRHALVPGILYLLAVLTLAGMVVRHQDVVRPVLGMPADGPGWRLPAWMFAALAVLAAGTVPAVLAFRRAAGRSYTADRVGFAAAGGLDVARWVPLGVLVGVYLAYAGTAQAASPDPLRAVRDPWVFLMAALVPAQVVVGVSAWWMFRARFGGAG